MRGPSSSRSLAGRLPPRVQLIQRELDSFERPRYLEIGVYIGVVLLNLRAARRVGVDPVNRINWRRRVRHPIGARGIELVHEPSDAFFERLPEDDRFDVVFIDGLHLREQVLRDIENSLRHLAPKGVILLHDCSPQSEAAASRDPHEAAKEGHGWCGDVWKAIVELRATRPDLQVNVIDTDFGIGVVRPQPSGRVPPLEVELANLEYGDLEANREQLLGLQPPGRDDG